jgi:hypothetical protein
MEFEITDPSGRKFIVTAPEGATQDQVLEYAKQNFAREQGRTANAAAPIGDNTQRAVIGGLTFGLADEFNAGVRSAVQAIPGMRGSDRTFSERYNQNLELERNRNRAFQQDNPVTATVAELGGGIVGPGLAMAPAQAGAGLMARMLRGGTSRGVVAGGTSGALAGFGEGEGGLGNRAENAANMGGLGAALGGTLGAGLSLAGKVGGRVLDGLGLRNPEVAGERQMLRALERGGRTVTDVEAPLMRPDTVMADVGGKPMQNLTAVAANTPSEAMETAERFVNSRRYARPDRVAGDVDRFMGGGGGTAVADEIGSLKATRSANAAPLYEAAFSKPTGVTDDLRVLLEDPIIRKALEQGREIQSREMRNVGRRPGGDVGNDPSIQFDERGVARLVGTPSTRTLASAPTSVPQRLPTPPNTTTMKLSMM